jgi:hypothetical protein
VLHGMSVTCSLLCIFPSKPMTVICPCLLGSPKEPGSQSGVPTICWQATLAQQDEIHTKLNTANQVVIWHDRHLTVQTKMIPHQNVNELRELGDSRMVSIGIDPGLIQQIPVNICTVRPIIGFQIFNNIEPARYHGIPLMIQ